MTREAALTVFLLVVVLGYSRGEGPEPVCTSRFDHDFKVLQKLADLDFELTKLKAHVSSLKHTEPSSTLCPDGWVPWEDKCYYFLSDKRAYSDAENYCKRKGAKLAEPNTSSANEFLKSRVRQYKTAHWWFGLSDQEVEGDWTWRSDGGRPSYFDWKRGNPNQGRKCNCGGLWHLYDYGWVDEPCHAKFNVICEMI